MRRLFTEEFGRIPHKSLEGTRHAEKTVVLRRSSTQGKPAKGGDASGAEKSPSKQTCKEKRH